MSDGEEWKGEPEPSGLFSSVFFGGPTMTPDQRAEYDAKQALRHSLLPPYRPARSCVKCGSERPARTLYYSTAFGEGREALARTCKRCNYCWYERTMSEEES